MYLQALAATVSLTWSTALAGVSLYACARGSLRRAARARSARETAPLEGRRLLVVRPCASRDEALGPGLRSLASARTRCALDVVLAVPDARDSAANEAHEAAVFLRSKGLSVRVIETNPRGPNRKVSQLDAAVRAALSGHDAVLVADADADLSGYDLDTLVAPLFASSPRARASCTWAPPYERSDRTDGDRASRAVLTASLQAFPLLSALDGRGMVGKLFALTPEVLARVGGFDSLRQHLGEDVELARRLRHLGARVVCVDAPVASLAQGRTRDEARARFTRWIQVVRAQRPLLLASYPALFFSTVPLGALALYAAPRFRRTASVALALTIGSRLLVARTAQRLSDRRTTLRETARDALDAELLLAQSFVDALRATTVTWRGHTLRFASDGTLVDAAPREPHRRPSQSTSWQPHRAAT